MSAETGGSAFNSFRKFSEEKRLFPRVALGAFIYTVLAVGWGVVVRAGKYGDGCGNHWPLCGPAVATDPLLGPISRVIESSHRISTALCGPIVLALLLLALLHLPKGHFGRKAAGFSFFMILVEAAIGGLLVVKGLVVENDTAARAAFMSAHAVSTFLLLGGMAVVAHAARGGAPFTIRDQRQVAGIVATALAGITILGLSGAISALAHQTHRVPNVLAAAKDPATHWLVRLQPFHPLIAISVGLYLFLACSLVCHLRPDPRVRRAAAWAAGLYAAQLAIGALNIVLDAPIVMQVIHLVMADLNFVSVVILGVCALAVGIERVEARPAPVAAGPTPDLAGRGLVSAYVALTKPRVISLLLFTTLTSAVAADGGWPGFGIMFALFVGGYLAAGAANAINMVIDRDIDLSMTRTASRPTVTQSISSPAALRFAFGCAALSFAILWIGGNLLTAALAFAGLVFYVSVYTLFLKRRTWHNIVIGGAAGAFPPLVGWAAVANALPPLALYLFAIVFVWTPVHFWALALLLKDDYAAAGVPMLPVVKGDRATVVQIALYTAVTVVVTLVPFALPGVGWIYFGCALALNAYLVFLCAKLYRRVDRPRASGLFHYSMLYLALLFLFLAVDRTVATRAKGSALPVSSSAVGDHRQDRQGIVMNAERPLPGAIL